MKHRCAALTLITLATFKATAWKLGPVAVNAEVWNASGAIFTAILILWIGVVYGLKAVMFASALTAGMELQTAACSIAYIIKPWAMMPGDDLCSAGLEFPVFTVSLWAFVCIAIYLKGEK